MLISVADKHAVVKRLRIKDRACLWSSSELSELIKDRNLARAKARSTDIDTDWLCFRQHRNRCTSMIKEAK